MHHAAAWPSDGLERIVACPACGAGRRTPLYDGLRDRLFGAPGEWTMWRCARCGSGYLDPRPTAESVSLAYADYFWHQAPRLPDAAPATAIARLRRAIRDDLLRRRLGYALPRLPLAAPLSVTAYGAALDRWARHLRPHGDPPRLLDVGCANGEFLLQMRALGWEATGIDIDDQALVEAKAAGLDVAHATLTDPGAIAGRRFDAITLNHVIEHLHSPAEALRGARELLEPSGMLWIATPNIRSLAHRAFGRDWLSLDPPRHLVVFAPDALGAVMRDAGFIDVRTPRPVRNARSVFTDSVTLRGGDLTPTLRLRAEIAQRVWERRPDVAEEIVVVARRPA